MPFFSVMSRRSWARWLSLVAFAGFFAGAAFAAQNEELPATGPQATFRGGVDLVTVRVTVKDNRGRPVINLRESDFTLLDRGRPRKLAGFVREPGPVGLALLFDVSGSMDVASRLRRAREAAFFLLSNLRSGEDEVAIYAFDKTLHLVQPFTTDLDGLRARFTSMEPWGMTSLHDAIASAAQHVAPVGSQRRALVVLTDGLDTSSRLTPAEVSRTASAIDVPVYVMAVALPIDARSTAQTASTEAEAVTGRLSDLARWTGGELHVTTGPSDASRAARGIIQELRHQYLLAFEPSREPGWHPLEVRVKGKGYVVRARGGYVAGQVRPAS
ncbi:MAG TPA: VWA domain-containing protein [Vicinamibacterales bacterium]|nr:VWA domain-containing protein [Vicinamibacterales bacterium]